MILLRGILARSAGMWLHALLLFLGLTVLAFSLLTALHAPVAVPWKLAVLAGEFGYALALVPLGLAVVAWSGRGDAPVMAMATLLVCVVAAGFLLKPVLQAWRVARNLPARLTAAFGPLAPAGGPFAVTGLLRVRFPSGPVQTHAFSPGLALDFYPAAGARTGAAGCVVIIHGGGWDGGDRKQLVGFNHWLTRQGWAVAAVSYRLAPAHPWPAQRDDVLAAIAWLKTHAADLGFDPARFVLLGRSAGGQIATAVGYLGDPAVRGVVALYAPQDMRFVWSVSRSDDALNSLKLMRQFLGGPPEGREELYDSASGQMLVRRGVTPPTLLIHGAIDTLSWVRHSERLAAALDAAQVPHLFVELPWATHAFEVNPGGPGGQLTAYALRWFLAKAGE
jgi:acetyl esterase/lipase